jgi:soluble lytic murein transglycosylase-like protein
MELALGIGVFTLVLGTAGNIRRLPPPSTAASVSNQASDQRPRAATARPQPDVKALLDAAADRRGLPRALVEATAYWESGWDQSRASGTGAVGLMQIQPEVAAEMGPRLLGHPVDLQDPSENADLGAAILKAYIDDQGGELESGLAAYYEGPGELAANGYSYDTAEYVAGVTALRDLLERGEPLPAPPAP